MTSPSAGALLLKVIPDEYTATSPAITIVLLRVANPKFPASS